MKPETLPAEPPPFIPDGGAVLLFKGRGFVSWCIRWQTRGRYSHAALLMPDGRVVESWQGAGVRVKELKDWDGIDIYLAPLTREQWAAAIAFAVAQVGRRYDWWAIIRFISRRNLPDNDERWFCSELVFAAIATGGLQLLERIDPNAVAPNHLSLSPLLKLRVQMLLPAKPLP